MVIFRLSAAHFNSHGVHYNRDYVIKEQGYSILIVPETLVSFLMMEMRCAQTPDRPHDTFGYPSEKPVPNHGPYNIFGEPDGDIVKM